MIYLFDKEEQLLDNGIIPKEDVLSSWQEQEINGLTPHTTEFKYRSETDTAEYFGVKDPEEKGLFWFYKIVSRGKDDNPDGKAFLKGINKFFDDLKGKGYVKDLRPQNALFSDYISQVLEGTGWTVGICNVSKKVTTSLYYISKLDAFWKLVDSAQCEFKTRVRFSNGKIIEQVVDFYDEISVDNGRIYAHGDKLLNVLAQTSEEFVPTAFLPRGKGIETEEGGYGRKLLINGIEWSTTKGDPVNKAMGDPVLELTDRTAIFGYKDGQPRLEIVPFDDIEDVNLLIQACYEYALENSRQKIQYQTKIIDDERVVAGEFVRIKSPKINAIYKARIFKVKRNFLNPKIKEVELGDKIITSRAEKTIQAQRAEEKKEELYISRLESVRQQIVTDWFGEDGYNYKLDIGNEYGLPAGFYSFNAPLESDPNELVGISAGKLIIAHKNESGNWQVLTGADGNGIHGDSIVTNSITVNKLAADVGQNLDLSSNESINLKVTKTVTNEVNTQLSNPQIQEQFKGDKGDTGAQGPQGPIGPIGPQGLQGIQGLEGPKGDQGIQGPVGKTGAKGATGPKGADGNDGIGISSATITYGVSSSSATQPSSWQTTIPSASVGQYLWTRTIIDYTDSTKADTVTYTYAYQGKDGLQGIQGPKGADGNSVTVTKIEYQAGTSATSPPTGTWSTSVVSVAAGQYLWTKTTFSDGKIAYGVARQGVNGAAGAKGADGKQVYFHTAYLALSKPELDDPYFSATYNSMLLYNLARDDSVTVTREANVVGSTQPIGDDRMKISHIKAGGRPNRGGFQCLFSGEASNTYYIEFVAKVPSGATLNMYNNSLGTGGSTYWITDNKGTGGWQTYAYIIKYGTGTISTGGHLSINYSTEKFDWYVSYYQRFNITDLFKLEPFNEATHIGTYADYSSTPSTDISKYSWSRLKPEDSVYYGKYEPPNKEILWMDSTDNIVKYFNGEEWVGLDREAINYVDSLAINISSDIQNEGDSIRQLVESEYYSKGDVDQLLQSKSTEIQQTDEEIQIKINAINNLIKANKEATDDEFANISTYFAFNDEGLLVGKDNVNFKALFNNEKLAFLDDNTEVAYISNKQLYVNDGRIVNSLQLGNFEFVPRESGNLTFRKIGG